MFELSPFIVLLIGIVCVVGTIVVLRINAFIALISAAILVSLLSPGDAADKIPRVAQAFGDTASGIAIVIAMASIIGVCLMESGAADRIVSSLVNRLGIERAPTALMGSGFLLSMPVFFDTVFYLLVPLARSLYRRIQGDYLLYILAISAGGVVTHVMVPPTPGPLIMAVNLDVNIGVMLGIGLLVAIPMSVAGLVSSYHFNRTMPLPMREIGATSQESDTREEGSQLPGLTVSLLPIFLPIALIASATIVAALAQSSTSAVLQTISDITSIIGNPSLALILAAVSAIVLLKLQRRLTLVQLAEKLEVALTSAGLIILITGAGGAFGKMIAATGIGDAIQVSAGETMPHGLLILCIAFGAASLLKFAQGSGTVAMITASGMIGAMGVSSAQLGFNPVYIATAIGAGSIVGDWMNDSGFWIVTKMSGFTEIETLKSWTIMLAIMGVTGFLMTLLLSQVLPLT